MRWYVSTTAFFHPLPQRGEQIASPQQAILQSDGEAQAWRVAMAQFLRPGLRLRQHRGAGRRGIGENLACRSQRDRTAAPGQQRESEASFRLLHLMGGGGLGEPEGARRGRQRAGGADGHQHREVMPADLHMKEFNG